MSLMMLYPQVAARTCGDCLKWWYTGNEAKPFEKFGMPQRRPPMIETPCKTCPKIPDDGGPRTRFRAIEWTPGMWRAYRHYKRCVAIGNKFEDDEAVECVAEHVSEVIEHVGRAREGAGQERMLAIIQMTAAMGKKR